MASAKSKARQTQLNNIKEFLDRDAQNDDPEPLEIRSRAQAPICEGSRRKSKEEI